MDIKISIIITVYNIETYVGECLDSVLGQQMKEIEVICINDASKDKSLDVLNIYALKDSRIRIIDLKNNVGPASARNVGYREARGEYVYQIDGDDRLADGALKKMYVTAKENDLDILTFSAAPFTDIDEYRKNVINSKKVYVRHSVYPVILPGVELMAAFIKNGDFHGNLWCNFVKKGFLRNNNIFFLDGLRYGEDCPFEMYLKAKRTMCIPDILYMRRLRNNSAVTSEKKLIHAQSNLCAFVHEFCLWQQENYSDFVEDQLYKYMINRWRSALQLFDAIQTKEENVFMLQKYRGAKLLYDLILSNQHTFWTNAYWKPQLIKQIKIIEQYDNVIIYGASLKAQIVINILEEFGIKKIKIAVSNNRLEKNLNGKVIYNIADLKSIANESIVLISVSKKNWSDIEKTLNEYNFKNYIFVE